MAYRVIIDNKRDADLRPEDSKKPDSDGCRAFISVSIIAISE